MEIGKTPLSSTTITETSAVNTRKLVRYEEMKRTAEKYAPNIL
jgi:hypothetical protein